MKLPRTCNFCQHCKQDEDLMFCECTTNASMTHPERCCEPLAPWQLSQVQFLLAFFYDRAMRYFTKHQLQVHHNSVCVDSFYVDDRYTIATLYFRHDHVHVCCAEHPERLFNLEKELADLSFDPVTFTKELLDYVLLLKKSAVCRTT